MIETNVMTDRAIAFANVTRRFGRRNVVDNLSLDCPAGSFTGLIGLNGAGKSTLLRMSVGLLAPTEGSIVSAGCNVRRDSVEMKRRVGYVPDRPNIYSWMRAGEAIAFVRKFHTTWNQPRCEDLIRRFRLPLETKVKHMSKGQAAKLQLLLAVCHDPAVLILDEPTSGFDPVVREEFFEGILEFAADRGQTILFSSHALADVQRLADRVALMHEGKLLMAGTTDEIIDRVKRVRVILEEDAGPPTPSSAALLQSPASVLREQRAGREWTLTIDHFSPATLHELRAKPGVTRLDVLDLNLDDVFKDIVRGRDEAAV
ncbi:MAG: ytrB 2 [Phycisphaerales bacterium]|nr:ytrB 2 [Phycisphaerales bacterium]